MRNKKSYKLDKIFRKILKCFNMFEHPDIWSNLEEKCQVKFRDSIRKNYMVQETRKSTLWHFHFCYNISTCLSTQISCRILKKTIWSFSGTQIRNKYMVLELSYDVLLLFFSTVLHNIDTAYFPTLLGQCRKQ